MLGGRALQLSDVSPVPTSVLRERGVGRRKDRIVGWIVMLKCFSKTKVARERLKTSDRLWGCVQHFMQRIGNLQINRERWPLGKWAKDVIRQFPKRKVLKLTKRASAPTAVSSQCTCEPQQDATSHPGAGGAGSVVSGQCLGRLRVQVPLGPVLERLLPCDSE